MVKNTKKAKPKADGEDVNVTAFDIVAELTAEKQPTKKKRKPATKKGRKASASKQSRKAN